MRDGELAIVHEYGASATNRQDYALGRFFPDPLGRRHEFRQFQITATGFFQLPDCGPNVLGIDDVISLEHATGAPAADFHNHAFSDSSPSQTAGSAPAQIMKQQPRAP